MRIILYKRILFKVLLTAASFIFILCFVTASDHRRYVTPRPLQGASADIQAENGGPFENGLTSIDSEESAGPPVLTIGVNGAFDGKWNPFIAESAYDRQVLDQIFIPVQYVNFENELEPFAGSCFAEPQEDGGVLYTITIQRGMRFSDGVPVTIDDYIYGLYVRADPSYIGKPGSLLGEFIEGIEEYYYDDPDYSIRLEEMENTAKERYSRETISYEDFLRYARETNLEGWWDGNPEGGYGGGTWREYITGEGYGERLAGINVGDPDEILKLITLIEYEKYISHFNPEAWFLDNLKREYAMSSLSGGTKVPGISGITRIDDYTCAVKYTKVNINAERGLTAKNGAGNLIPRHYYGEFTKGNVSSVIENMVPMGSGPYIWGGFEDNAVTCGANPDFFMGPPRTETVRWRYIPQDIMLLALKAGEIQICNPDSSLTNLASLELLGYRFDMIDNAGYGYLGMNTERLPLPVRKGFVSLMDRRPSVESYYGPLLAQVIERPMSVTLAEYPRDAAAYYPVSSELALNYFQQAGYSQRDAKLVDGTGRQLTIHCFIAGNGEGDHPGFAMLEEAAGKMAALGGELRIHDVDFNVAQEAMNNGTADSWVIAWGTVNDCDKSSQFHSLGGQNRYRFKDARMDGLLETIIQTADLNQRRAVVAEMLDYAMDMCLELPLYQRKNIIAYNESLLNMDTIPYAATACDYEQFLYRVELAEQGRSVSPSR